jgi:hypothetical protein
MKFSYDNYFLIRLIKSSLILAGSNNKTDRFLRCDFWLRI